MRPQLIMSAIRPNQAAVQPIRYDSEHPKPHGGVWTSSDQGDGTSEWTDEKEKAGRLESVWQLVPEKDVRIYTVASQADEERLMSAYKAQLPADEYEAKLQHWAKSGVIDWEAFARDWDALHYTPGYRHTDLSAFSQWDVESTLWTRWAFTDVLCVRQRPQLAARDRLVDIGEIDWGAIDQIRPDS